MAVLLTAIEPTRKGRFALFADGEFLFSVDGETLARIGLREGDTLDGETLAQLRENSAYRYAYDIARHHHERWDGNGYPDGLKGEEISIWAQIVSLADVYDALRCERIYKKAFSRKKTLKMIRSGQCGIFNPELLECFFSVEEKLTEIYDSEGEQNMGKISTSGGGATEK